MTLPLRAISYDTATFRDLKYFLKEEESIEIDNIEPEEFFSTLDNQYQYINLISNDTKLRAEISEHLDRHNLVRFTYIHPSASVSSTVGLGVLIYPNVTVYPNVVINNDIIIHANSAVGHQANIGQGTYISGGCMIGGSTNIGNYCYIGLSVTLYDKISIQDFINVAAGAIIKNNLLESGTYASVVLNKKIN